MTHDERDLLRIAEVGLDARDRIAAALALCDDAEEFADDADAAVRALLAHITDTTEETDRV